MRTLRQAKYLSALAFSTALVLAIALFISAWFDPAADFFFLTGWNPHPINRIDNYADVKFKRGLVKSLKAGGIDAAVFGSSRALRIDPDSPGFKEFGDKTFNLAVQGARLPSVESFLSIAKRNSPHMVAVVALDFFSFGKDDGVPAFYLDPRRKFAAYGDVVQRMIDIRSVGEALAKPDPNPRHRLLLNGRDVMARRPEEIRGLPGYLESFQKKSLADVRTYDNFEYEPAMISRLQYLRASEAPVIFFINPESRWYRDVLQRSSLWPTYLRWKNDLAGLGGVVDFSGSVEITDDMSMYFDEHHYLDNAGKLIMEDVANAYFGRPLKHGKILGK